MNMIDPTLDELVGKVGNRYAMVVVLSKRSRQVVNNCLRDDIRDVRAVSEAVLDLDDDCLIWTEPFRIEGE